jgi:hypothetical protein
MRPARITTAILLLLLSIPGLGQEYRPLRKQADSLYRTYDYRGAIPWYLKAVAAADFAYKKADGLYQVATCYSLLREKDSAMIILSACIRAGFHDKAQLVKDKNLTPLHGEKEWEPLVASVIEEKKVLHADPKKSIIYTIDIDLFWAAYDRAQQDTANRVAIYKQYYFDKGSKGMQDYMGLKVSSIRAFVRHYDERPAFYRDIRNNTLNVDSLKPGMYGCFDKLKIIYPQAVFPDIYFIMGAYTSAGTVTNAGLLLGVNQICASENTPLGELTLWQKNVIQRFHEIPLIVAHELIHFEQDSLMSQDDTTTLFNAEIEGMADFLGEMIAGKTINQRLHVWAKGKEKKIWAAFTKEMYLNRSFNWMGNAEQERPDYPADQGYWVGYQICKAYYQQAENKQQAIYDMLHFKDSKAFLQKSGWEKIVAALPDGP